MPKRCGIDFLMPKFKPEAIIIMLFGPGVIVITKE